MHNARKVSHAHIGLFSDISADACLTSPNPSRKKDKRTTTTLSIGTSSAASSPPPSVSSVPTLISGSECRASLPDDAPKQRKFERFPSSPDALSSKEGVSKDPLGLTVIHEPDTPPLLDIIFVHGLGGTSRATWPEQGDLDYFWPQKWLPFEPGTRSASLLSFGYNFAYAATWSDPMTSIADVAKGLLYSIKCAKYEYLKELKRGWSNLPHHLKEFHTSITSPFRDRTYSLLTPGVDLLLNRLVIMVTIITAFNIRPGLGI